MTWTYSGNPSSSDRDEVRFLLGDTDTSDQLISDEELDYLLTVHPDDGAGYSNYEAAAAAARQIAARFTRQIDKSVGSLSISYGSRAQQFRDLADMLKEEATKGKSQKRMGGPVLGGGGEKFLMGNDWKGRS